MTKRIFLNDRKIISFILVSFLSFFMGNLYAQILIPMHPDQIPVSSYRGKRNSDSDSESSKQRKFFVEKISVEQNAEQIVIILAFNIPVNPLSLSNENITVNSAKLPSSAVTKFNKTGTELRMAISIEDVNKIAGAGDQDLYVVIRNIKAYDGAKMDERQIDKLEFTVSYSYSR